MFDGPVLGQGRMPQRTSSERFEEAMEDGYMEVGDRFPWLRRIGGVGGGWGGEWSSRSGARFWLVVAVACVWSSRQYRLESTCHASLRPREVYRNVKYVLGVLLSIVPSHGFLVVRFRRGETAPKKGKSEGKPNQTTMMNLPPPPPSPRFFG